MIAIILAAGYAMRLYPLTEHMPKALLPIGKRPMLNYLMDAIASIPDIKDVHLVTNDRFYGQFTDWRDGAPYPGLNIHILNDGTSSNEDRLGAIGDLSLVIERAGIDDDLLVCVADNFFTFPLTDFADDFRRTGRDTLLMKHIDNVDTLRGFAVATLDEDGVVTSLVEKPKDPPTDIGVYGLYLYRRDTVPLIKTYLDEGNSPDAPGHFPEWLYKRREVRGYLFDGECIDIGTEAMYRAMCARFEEEGDDQHG